MRPTLVAVTGSPGLLAAHIAATKRALGERVVYLGPALEHARFAALADQLAGEASAPPVERVSPDALGGAEVWHFRAAGEPIDHVSLEMLRATGARELNLVATPFCGGQRWRWLLPQAAAAEAGDPQAVGSALVRNFRTTLTIGTAPPCDIAQEGVHHFLATLFDLQVEIEARVGEFFEYRALRCAIPPDAVVNIVPVQQAAAMILATADRAGEGDYLVAGSTEMSGEAFLETIGNVYGVSLLGTAREVREAPAETSLDALFDLRLAGFAGQLGAPPRALAEHCREMAGFTPDQMALDPDSFEQLVDQARRRQLAEHREMAARAEVAPDPGAGQIERDGRKLRYRRAGTDGPVLALVNAFGQGHEAWSRLIALLSPRFRVLSWDLRGLEEGEPPMSVADHVADLAAILDEEGVDRVHLVAWCTGPKIAAEFASRFPERVRSLLWLNTTMKSLSSPPALDTPYERNFQMLCHALEQRPAMAGSIMESLVASAQVAESELLDEEEEASRIILAAMNRDLRKPVLRPFRSEDSTIRYARQLIDFWNNDVSIIAGKIQIPMLILASEYDGVATPQASEWANQLFSQARVLQIPGATHYFLYDRADVIARATEWFISDIELV